MHYKEQYTYFFPDVKFYRLSDSTLKDNEVFIFNGDCQGNNLENDFLNTEALGKKLFRIVCDNNTFTCPLDYQGDFKINY